MIVKGLTTEHLFLNSDLPRCAFPCTPCRICSLIQAACCGWRTAQTQETPHSQVLGLGVTVLRLTSRQEDRPAGLALISSLRKRLANLPTEDELWRVRLPKTT